MDDILKTVQSSYDNLAPAQRAVAEFIVDHYQEIPFLSVTAMAKKIQVSDTTIIKYCMEIGFSGFGDFKKQITERVKSESDWLSRMEQNLTSLGDRDGYETVYKVATENLKSTINNPMNRQNYEKLLNQLDRAADIYVMGFRTSAILAELLANSLTLAGRRAFLIAPGRGDLHTTALCMTPKDLLISIAFSRYSVDALNIANQATEMHVPHVAITDSLLSPIAVQAEYAFVCEVRSATNVPSIVSASGLIEAIMTGYVQRHPEETKAYMGSVENYLSKNRILLSSN